MGKRRINWPDLLLGAFLIAVAAITFAATSKLSLGNAANMGPRYMPYATAWIIMAFGVYFAASGLAKPFESILEPHARPVVGVLAAGSVFALLLMPLGLLVASTLAVVVAGFASADTRAIENLVFGVLIAGASVLLFVKALMLPVPVWPW